MICLIFYKFAPVCYDYEHSYSFPLYQILCRYTFFIFFVFIRSFIFCLWNSYLILNVSCSSWGIWISFQNNQKVTFSNYMYHVGVFNWAVLSCREDKVPRREAICERMRRSRKYNFHIQYFFNSLCIEICIIFLLLDFICLSKKNINLINIKI